MRGFFGRCRVGNRQFHTSSRVLSIHRLLGRNIYTVGPYRKSDMSDSISQKRHRIRAASVPYARLRKEILARDNWRCQVCGRLKNLDVHHLRRRSALGEDLETNLITLCRECHQMLHGSAPTGNSSNVDRPMRRWISFLTRAACSVRMWPAHITGTAPILFATERRIREPRHRAT